MTQSRVPGFPRRVVVGLGAIVAALAWRRFGRRDVRWLAAGEGEPVLVLASPFLLARSYRPLLRVLASRRRVLVLELAGFEANRVAYVRAFLDRMGLRRATIVGHSNSSSIARRFAALHPSRTVALVLSGATGADTQTTPLRLVLRRLVDGLGEPLFSLWALAHVAVNLARFPRAFAKELRVAGTPDLEGPWPGPDTPVLLAWGARDWTTRRRSLHTLRRRMPHARMALLPGRHDAVVTAPEALAPYLFDESKRSGNAEQGLQAE